MNSTIDLQSVTYNRCYCEPSFEQAFSECDPNGCKASNGLILFGFTMCFTVCLFRLNQLYSKKENIFPLVTLTLLITVCLIRIIRSFLVMIENENFIIMGFLYVLPLGLLICSFFCTLLVWAKIIYHINFSKIVSRFFPRLRIIFIAAQILLMTLFILVVCAGFRYNATNIVLCFFLSSAAIFACVFTKMIWNEYKDISSKDSGVFNQSNHQKIKKIFKLSTTSIVVTFLTIGLTIWSFIVGGKLTIQHAIAFNLIGRSVEICWVVIMLIILAPQLQTWGKSPRTPGNVINNNTNFSDEEEYVSSNNDDIEKGSNISSSPDNSSKNEHEEQTSEDETTTATIKTSPTNHSPLNSPKL